MLNRPLAWVLVVVLLTGSVATNPVSAAPKTKSLVGRKVADFSLKDYRGREHSLAEYKASGVVVLAFLGTECPLAKLYAPRLQELSRQFDGKGVTILGVNSNRHDSVTEIAAYARRHSISFPVLKDAGNVVADAIGVQRTPEVVVLDDNRVVRYHGRIDDQYGVGYIRDEPQQQYLRTALEDLVAGRNVKQSSTEVVGCFIGRVRKPKSNSRVTYSNQVARVLQKHCVECHRQGEIAPFALTSYDEVVGWGDTMLEVIEDQRMPPWHADPKHGEFRNSRVMTDQERRDIRDWVAAGCPEGDRSQLPEPLQFVEGWHLPKQPDVVINMRDKPFDVQAEGTVRYQYFRVDPGFKEDRWVHAAELQPGNRAVVHHILVFVAPPRGNRSRSIAGTTGEFLAAYVPGYRAPAYPRGMAKRIPAGSQLVFQMHYTPIGTPQTDLSRLGLVFADPKDITKVVVTQQASERRGLKIPPHADNHRVEARSNRAPVEVELLAFMPHMHLRGKSFRYEARFANGDREVLLDVPRYDFNWQTNYRLKTPLKMPVGSYLQCVAHFDNSENNLNNPDPTATVRWGDQTWNEMMIGYFDVAVPTRAFGAKNAAEMASGGSTAGERTSRSAEIERTGARIIQAISRLDRNKDGKLQESEVPANYKPIFKRLDENSDGVLTTAEARKSIDRIKASLKRN